MVIYQCTKIQQLSIKTLNVNFTEILCQDCHLRIFRMQAVKIVSVNCPIQRPALSLGGQVRKSSERDNKLLQPPEEAELEAVQVQGGYGA